jgi:hypothetical protein
MQTLVYEFRGVYHPAISHVGAAVSAGLGVAALAQRVAPPGAIDVGKHLGLPPMPLSEIVLYARASEAR